MEEKYWDLVLVPLGLLVLATYHSWLLLTILRHPKRTVIGLNALARQRWVRAMMADPLKNGVLAVQTLRNNIMASTVLATTAITLASLISVFVGASTTSSAAASLLVYGNKTARIASVKFFAISLCFILAFLCIVQSIRYYAHVSFLLVVPATTGALRDGGVSVAYVARSLNRGSFFWSLGLRAFYASFTLFVWIFGPVPMLASSVVICCLLYFLDTTTGYTRDLHDSFGGDEEEAREDA
ncbi:uncharacterized protein LOC103705643 [Phoenix dactylifera]|uniref:Uncharacterized protein LOC103705643 n=1 Tax=Phoenix dactylifera TaxID=42345 RepID=A0A8B9A4M7_PHODC|nr:uncharacterized protein LOC103705643 [Phoenix dactylifera]